MQYFQDPTGKVWAFEPDVVAAEAAGIWSFKSTAGTPLGVPANLTPCANNTPPGPTLAQVQAAQASTISAACSAAITGGFASSALGSAYGYGSEAIDQTNIATAAALANGGALWCATSAGQWSLMAHTGAQAQQVRADLWAHIQACQTKYAGLLASIASATTIAAVQAISW